MKFEIKLKRLVYFDCFLNEMFSVHIHPFFNMEAIKHQPNSQVCGENHIDNFLNHECQCEWNQKVQNHSVSIEQISFNFWSQYEKFCIQNGVQQEQEELLDSFIFYNMKSICLGNKFNPTYMLHMGLDPKRKFEFFCRIESKRSMKSIVLNVKQLTKTLNDLKEITDCNISYPSASLANVSLSSVRVLSRMEQMFDIRTNTNSMLIDEKSALQLVRLEPFINKILEYSMNIQKECKVALIDILHVFANTKKNSFELCSVRNLREFLVKSLNLNCACLPHRNFIAEMGIQWMDWICECVPIFLNISMLDESTRLNTFQQKSFKRLHSEINYCTFSAAKYGLYFNNDSTDSLRCAFCFKRIIILSFQQNILRTHFQQSSDCKLLLDPVTTQNIPIEGSNVDLKSYFAEMLPIDENN